MSLVLSLILSESEFDLALDFEFLKVGVGKKVKRVPDLD